MAFPGTPEPNHVQELGTEYLMTRKKALDGTPHTRLHNDAEVRRWQLEYQALDDTDLATLDSYRDTVKDDYTADTWTHPRTSESITVRIQSYRRAPAVAYGLTNVTIVLEEDVS